MKHKPRKHACGQCGRQDYAERMVYSAHTGNRYCWPGRGCQSDQALKKKHAKWARLSGRRVA
jgi:hypothetical protein